MHRSRAPARLVARAAGPALALILAACAASDVGEPPEGAARGSDAPAQVTPALRARVARGEPQRVLAVLDGSPSAADAVLDALGARRAAARRFRSAPVVAMTVADEGTLDALAAVKGVARVVPDEPHAHALSSSLPLIGQPAALAAGHDGGGTSVAVLDTGCDWTRAAFGACSAPGAAGCKVAFAKDFADEDGAPDAHGHGTNVSAIVLGVAPATKILALDVFEGEVAWSSDILAAMDWVLEHRVEYGIAAVNMSLGGARYDAPCSGSVLATAIASARAVGVLSAVAAGNDGWTSELSHPACAPAALSVGAVYDRDLGSITYSKCSDPVTSADRVTCFSNGAPFLQLLAPGALITAGGYTMAGTSQAAPHVAGAVALLRAAFPGESADQIAQRLVSSGKSVVDPRSGQATPRVDVAAALAACVPEVTPRSLEVDATTGSATLAVGIGPGCAWTLEGASDWLSAAPSAGKGSGPVSISWEANAGAQRVAIVTVAGLPVEIVQRAAPPQPPPPAPSSSGPSLDGRGYARAIGRRAAGVGRPAAVVRALSD